MLDPERHGQGAHPDPGHRRVGDVDEVDAGVAQEPGGLDRPLDADAPRRIDLDRDDEVAGVEELGQAGRWRRVVAAVAGGRPVRRAGWRSRLGPCRSRRGRWCRGRLGRVDRRSHRRDVLGRRPAAAADDPGAGLQQARRHGPEVLGARGVDEAALESLREPGVGHDRPRGVAIGGSAHRLEGIETGDRPGPAVDPDGVRACRGQRGGGHRRAVAVGQDEFLAEGQRGDDRDVRRAAGLVDGENQLLEVGERLEHDQVRPALEQAVDLLAECGPRDGLGEDRPSPRRRTQRPDRATHERVAPADLACLAGELRGPPVERADLSFEAPSGQPLPVGTERQGLDQLGARLEVLAMGRPDHLRVGRDELLEAGSLRHAPAEQQRAQPAIDQQRAVGEAASEALSRRAGGRGLGHRSPIERVDRAAGPEMTRPFLLGRVSKGVPLSCRRTCPDLAPCRLDAGRLSWLQRAGPSATLDKNLFGCGAMVPHAAQMSKVGRDLGPSRGGSAPGGGEPTNRPGEPEGVVGGPAQPEVVLPRGGGAGATKSRSSPAQW